MVSRYEAWGNLHGVIPAFCLYIGKGFCNTFNHMKIYPFYWKQKGRAVKGNTILLNAFGAGQHLRHRLFQLLRKIRAFRFEVMPYHQIHRGVSRQRPQNVHVYTP